MNSQQNLKLANKRMSTLADWQRNYRLTKDSPQKTGEVMIEALTSEEMAYLNMHRSVDVDKVFPTKGREIIPLGDRVLILPIEVKSGSIILTDNDGYLHGEVLAIGEGQAAVNGTRMPMDVAVGDVVIYGNVQSTIEDTLNDKLVKLVQHHAIVGIIKE